MSDLNPPGLFYDKALDALRIHLARWSDDVEVEMRSTPVRELLAPNSELRLLAMTDPARPVLRVVVIAKASRHVAKEVLERKEGEPLAVHQEPDVLMVPFFPEAVGVTKRVHMLDAGDAGRLGVALARSGRVVGLVVPDHRARLIAPLGDAAA